MPRARVPAGVRSYLLADCKQGCAGECGGDGRHGWIEFVESVNVPIISKIAPSCSSQSSAKRRVLWAFVLVACTAFSAYQISTQIILHYDYPVNVVYDTVEVDGVERVLEFPAVTICNNNYLRRSALESGAGAVLRDLYGPHEADKASFKRVANYSNEDWLKLYDRVQHTVEDMIVKCTWMTRPCHASDFVVTYTDMGRCYSFNLPMTAAAIKNVTASGANYGLKLLLDAQIDDYIFSPSDSGLGFKVFIHNQSDTVPSMSNHGTSVGVGFITNVEVSLQHVQLLPPPHGICVDGPGLPQLKYPSYRDGKPSAYTEKSCWWECVSDCVVRQCGCKDFYYPATNVGICDPRTTRACVRPKYIECASGSGGCTRAACPLPCQLFKYSTAVHSMPIADALHSDLGGRDAGDSDSFKSGNPAHEARHARESSYWKRNLAQLNVYYYSLSYESLQHTPAYPAMQLFCDIGGALGLLLGATLITALEVLDYLIIKYFPRLI